MIPLTDRGFRYGMAVFETLRVQGGKVGCLGEHLWRLARACRASGFPVPGGALRDTARRLREVAGVDRDWTGVARLHVTAGDGGPADPPRECRLLISLEPRQPPPGSLVHVGLRLRAHPTPHHPPFGGRKTHNYWGNADALQAARRTGVDEALLSDPDGRLISACMANVFLFRDGELFTPPVSRGARAGVQRARVLRLTGATVRDLFPSEWRAPGTGFLVTNSWLGAVPGFVVGAEPEGATRDALAAIVRRVHEERKG